MRLLSGRSPVIPPHGAFRILEFQVHIFGIQNQAAAARSTSTVSLASWVSKQEAQPHTGTSRTTSLRTGGMAHFAFTPI